MKRFKNLQNKKRIVVVVKTHVKLMVIYQKKIILEYLERKVNPLILKNILTYTQMKIQKGLFMVLDLKM